MQNSTMFNPLAWMFPAADAGAAFFAPQALSTRATRTRHDHCTHGRYSLYVPASVKPLSLVVMLHGAGQDAEDFAAGTQMDAVAEREGFVVLYPEQFAENSSNRCWRWFDPQHQQPSESEPARIADLTRSVAVEQGVDPGCIFIAGMSAGGAMASLVGSLFPETYAAVGVHSGLAPRAASCMRTAFAAMRGEPAGSSGPTGMPTVVFHGDQDSVVHPSNGMRVIEAACGTGTSSRTTRSVSADGRSFTRRRYVGEDFKVLGEHWTLHGADHAWSGGSRRGSFTDAAGPCASLEMLRFFKRHRLQV